MKFGTVLAIAMLSFGSLSVALADDAPKPKGGTVKGAAVGAAAGHAMGGHTKTGAVAGAAIAHARWGVTPGGWRRQRESRTHDF